MVSLSFSRRPRAARERSKKAAETTGWEAGEGEEREQHKTCVHAQKRQRRIHGVVRAACEIAPSPLSSLRNKTISPPSTNLRLRDPRRNGVRRRALRARQFIADNSIATWVTTWRYSARSDSFFFSFSLSFFSTIAHSGFPSFSFSDSSNRLLPPRL